MDCLLKDGTLVVVHEASAGDLDELRRIRNVPDAVHLERLAAQERGEVSYLVVDFQGRVLGHLLVLWSGKPSQPDFPDVTDILVRRGYRRRGIGLCLLEAAEKIVKKRGYDRIGLSVDPVENPRAKRLYERIGYVAAGEPYVDVSYSWVDEAGVRHTRDVPTIDMMKKL